MKKSNCNFLFFKLIIILSLIVINNNIILFSKTWGEDKSLKNEGGFKGIRVVTDKAVLDTKARYTEFLGNAKVTFNGIEMKSDRIRINYKSVVGKDIKLTISEESITQIIANGNVKISFEDKIATSKEALYLPDKDTLVLTGENSKIISGNDYITGDKIIFNRKDKTFKVESSGKKQVEAVFFSEENKQ